MHQAPLFCLSPFLVESSVSFFLFVHQNQTVSYVGIWLKSLFLTAWEGTIAVEFPIVGFYGLSLSLFVESIVFIRFAVFISSVAEAILTVSDKRV